MMTFNKLVRPAGGFTVIELLIMVVILSILAAMLVPRFATSSSGARYSALDTNLGTVRGAIELYHQQHGVYPGATASSGGVAPTGSTPGTGAEGTAQSFIDQLTMYSNSAGQTATVGDASYRFGPYLEKGLPVEPVSEAAIVEISTTGELGMTATPGINAGWKFDNRTGQLIANSAALQMR